MSRAKLLAFACGVAALLAAVAYAGAAAVEQAALRVGIVGLALVALIHLPVIAATGSAWWLIGGELPGAAPWKFIWARYVREATAEVLPFSQLGGIVAGARTLTLTGLESVPVAATLLADLIIEQLAKLPYVLAGVAMLLLGARGAPLRLIAAALLPVCAVAMLAGLGRRRCAVLLRRGAEALARRWPALRLQRPGQLDRLFNWDRRSAAALATHTLAWALGAAETWVVCHLMGLAVSPAQALILDSVFCGLRTFGFAVPAALGVQEAGYVLACALIGVPAAPAVALSLLRRVRELLVGAPALGLWQAVEGGRAHAGLAGK